MDSGERTTAVSQIGRLGLRQPPLPRSKALLGQAILRKFILPKAHELVIQKRFGWHTYFSTLLSSVGTEFKVMQELLRNSSLRSTLDIYTQAITPSKHAAQAAVMSLVLSAKGARGFG